MVGSSKKYFEKNTKLIWSDISFGSWDFTSYIYLYFDIFVILFKLKDPNMRVVE